MAELVYVTTRLSPELVVQVHFDPADDNRPFMLRSDDDLAPIDADRLTSLQRETILEAVGVWLLQNGYRP